MLLWYQYQCQCHSPQHTSALSGVCFLQSFLTVTIICGSSPWWLQSEAATVVPFSPCHILLPGIFDCRIVFFRNTPSACTLFIISFHETQLNLLAFLLSLCQPFSLVSQFSPGFTHNHIQFGSHCMSQINLRSNSGSELLSVDLGDRPNFQDLCILTSKWSNMRPTKLFERIYKINWSMAW